MTFLWQSEFSFQIARGRNRQIELPLVTSTIMTFGVRSVLYISFFYLLWWMEAQQSQLKWKCRGGFRVHFSFNDNLRTRWSSKKRHPSVCRAQLSVRKVLCGPLLVDTIPQDKHPVKSWEAILMLGLCTWKKDFNALGLLDNVISCQTVSRKGNIPAAVCMSRTDCSTKTKSQQRCFQELLVPLQLWSLSSGIYRWEWLGLGEPRFSMTCCDFGRNFLVIKGKKQDPAANKGESWRW